MEALYRFSLYLQNNTWCVLFDLLDRLLSCIALVLETQCRFSLYLQNNTSCVLFARWTDYCRVLLCCWRLCVNFHPILQNNTSWVLYNMAAFYWRIRGEPLQVVECLRRALHFSPRSGQTLVFLLRTRSNVPRGVLPFAPLPSHSLQFLGRTSESRSCLTESCVHLCRFVDLFRPFQPRLHCGSWVFSSPSGKPGCRVVDCTAVSPMGCRTFRFVNLKTPPKMRVCWSNGCRPTLGQTSLIFRSGFVPPDCA